MINNKNFILYCYSFNCNNYNIYNYNKKSFHTSIINFSGNRTSNKEMDRISQAPSKFEADDLGLAVKKNNENFVHDLRENLISANKFPNLTLSTKDQSRDLNNLKNKLIEREVIDDKGFLLKGELDNSIKTATIPDSCKQTSELINRKFQEYLERCLISNDPIKCQADISGSKIIKELRDSNLIPDDIEYDTNFALLQDIENKTLSTVENKTISTVENKGLFTKVKELNHDLTDKFKLDISNWGLGSFYLNTYALTINSVNWAIMIRLYNKYIFERPIPKSVDPNSNRMYELVQNRQLFRYAFALGTACVIPVIWAIQEDALLEKPESDNTPSDNSLYKSALLFTGLFKMNKWIKWLLILLLYIIFTIFRGKIKYYLPFLFSPYTFICFALIMISLNLLEYYLLTKIKNNGRIIPWSILPGFFCKRIDNYNSIAENKEISNFYKSTIKREVFLYIFILMIILLLIYLNII